MSGRKLIDADELKEEMRKIETDFNMAFPGRPLNIEQVTILVNTLIKRVMEKEEFRKDVRKVLND